MYIGKVITGTIQYMKGKMSIRFMSFFTDDETLQYMKALESLLGYIQRSENYSCLRSVGSHFQCAVCEHKLYIPVVKLSYRIKSLNCSLKMNCSFG